MGVGGGAHAGLVGEQAPGHAEAHGLPHADAGGAAQQWSGYNLNVFEQSADASVLYTPARGESVPVTCAGAALTVRNGVSPSSGDLDNGTAQTLTVSAPDTAGRCTLVVEYTIEVSYTTVDENGDEVTNEETLNRTEEFPIRVVEPITLSVTLTNNTNTDLNGYGVYFYVNDERIEDSYTTVDLDEAGTTTVTYEWITDSGNGQYEFYVLPADGGNMVDIEGLGERHTFYIGDNDYTWMIALLVIVIILLIIVMVWVYRKPVKNYGKPKSRR